MPKGNFSLIANISRIIQLLEYFITVHLELTTLITHENCFVKTEITQIHISLNKRQIKKGFVTIPLIFHGSVVVY